MKPFLAEDIRTILNKLDEYLININEEDKEKSPEDDVQADADAEDKDDAESIDDVLTKPAGLEKIVGNLNVQALIHVLELPEDMHSNFRSAINALKADEPVLSTSQAMALAVAFDHLLALNPKNISRLAPGSHGVAEDLDANKIKSYMDRDKTPAGPNDSVDQMKNMIAAVGKHGSPEEKKELGLNEEEVSIIGYNSGHGENIDVIAKDPTRHRTVQMIQLRIGSRGQPELVFKDTDGDKYVADWHPKYGWVADFD